MTPKELEHTKVIAEFDGLRLWKAEYNSKSDGLYDAYYDDLGRHANSLTPFCDYMLKYNRSVEILK